MEELIYKINWSDTPLGPVEKWPRPLKAAVNMCLHSNTPAFICWGNDLTFLCNNEWMDLVESENEDYSLLGSPAHKIFEDNWPLIETDIKKVLSTGEVKKSNKPRSLPGRKQREYNLIFNPLWDEKGKTRGVFVLVEPYTFEPTNEGMLDKSEQKLSAFFENAPVGIHCLKPDGTIIQVNQAELDFLGYTREEYIGHNIAEFYVDKELVEDVLHELQEVDEIHNVESQMIHKDGSIRDVSLTSNAFRKNGEFIHTRCFTRDITERKQWERKYGESKSRYQTLAKNFPKGAVALFNEDLRYTALGGELVTEMGTTPDTRIGKKITAIYPEEIINDLKPYLHRVFNGEAYTFEVTFQDRRLTVQLLPIKNDRAEITSGMLVVQDITQRWQAQQELHESEAKFRMMAENLNEIIGMVSEDGKDLIYINPAFEKIFGVDRETLYNDTLYFLKFIHPEDQQRVWEQFKQLPETDFKEEFRIIRPDGGLRWIHGRASKVVSEDSKITRIVGFAEDITKKKCAEMQLRNSRNRLRAALEIDTVGVIFWDTDEVKIKEVNEAFLEMTGLNHEEALGMSWQQLTPKEFYPPSEKAVQNLQTTGRTTPYIKQYIRKDGSRFWGLFAPRKIDENEMVEFVLDITDRKEAQRKLEELNETLEERVAKRTQQLRSLASQLNKMEEIERQRLATELHDTLSQMLSVAKMKLESIFQNPLSNEIKTELEDLKKITVDALEYNQNLIMELKPPPALNKEDATEVLYWTANKMRKKGLNITIKDDGEVKPVNKECQYVLHQSVRELLQNVIKHADTKQVWMHINIDNGFLKVTVEDKGKGFDIENTALVPTEGQRFGLFNMKERLEWHGGKFEIHSAPGKGTKVSIWVPLKGKSKPEPDEAIQDEEISQHLNLKKEIGEPSHTIKILLVDDHDIMRRGLRQMIEQQADIEILGEASDGQQAVELAQKTNPNIIIMDINMPVMDGLEATKIIKEQMPSIQIIGLSVHQSVDVKENMLHAGASAYLTKNEAFEKLVKTIRQITYIPKN